VHEQYDQSLYQQYSYDKLFLVDRRRDLFAKDKNNLFNGSPAYREQCLKGSIIKGLNSMGKKVTAGEKLYTYIYIYILNI